MPAPSLRAGRCPEPVAILAGIAASVATRIAVPVASNLRRACSKTTHTGLPANGSVPASRTTVTITQAIEHAPIDDLPPHLLGPGSSSSIRSIRIPGNQPWRDANRLSRRRRPLSLFSAPTASNPLLSGVRARIRRGKQNHAHRGYTAKTGAVLYHSLVALPNINALSEAV